MSLRTVNKHVTHVLGKLGAANRTEATARARELGLLPDPRPRTRPAPPLLPPAHRPARPGPENSTPAGTSG